MDTSPTAYPLQPHMLYGGDATGIAAAGGAFNPSFPRSSFSPYPQPQDQYPHQQQPYLQGQPAYPTNPRNNPSPYPQSQKQPSPHGHLQSPTANGGLGVLNQPGAFQGVDGLSAQAYSAPPYTQSVPSSGIPSSLPQPVSSSIQSNTFAPPTSQTMAAPPQMISPNTPTAQQQRPSIPNGAYPAQNNQTQTQGQGLAPPLSPKSATREKLRVALLLEINSHLLQEIISLQQQGKAGLPGQPSPTTETAAGSPISATDPHAPFNNSPVDTSKPTALGVKQQPSQECADCMRRLQANLSYLAAVADRHKRVAASFPASPAIMTPPPHLQNVRDLYKKLNAVFPGALQALAKQNAMVVAQAQAQIQSQGPGYTQPSGAGP